MDDILKAFAQAVGNAKLDKQAPGLNRLEREGLAISWVEFFDKVPGYWLELSDTDLEFAIGAGILAERTAAQHRSEGDQLSLETVLDKELDVKNGLKQAEVKSKPYSFFLKNVAGSTSIPSQNGSHVATVSDLILNDTSEKYSMLRVVDAYYSKASSTRIGDAFVGVAPFMTYVGKYIVTPQGVPSYAGFFSKIEADSLKTSDVSVVAPLMQQVRDEFSGLRASDVTTLAVVKALDKAYVAYKKNNTAFSEQSKADREMIALEIGVITMVSASICQLVEYISRQGGGVASENASENDGESFSQVMVEMILDDFVRIAAVKESAFEGMY
ncbi:hypothetical protein [Levilactobacillus koreensis]|uniref:Uncharacterized protein n=1 Tax=Levilactobacillus koreensis TaxID=637971 RepID=A0AAC9ERA8_9LACO|nr:hypothetical protein [Levilactobacillus koreensis]AKP64409.1 hypothetical protein ABN16_04945 [Levilactobacillus koreensis]